MVAHAAEHSDDGAEEAAVVHWLGELNVAKVAWAFDGVCTISCAQVATLPLVVGAHPEVAEASHFGLPLLVGVTGLDLGDRVAPLIERESACE